MKLRMFLFVLFFQGIILAEEVQSKMILGIFVDCEDVTFWRFKEADKSRCFEKFQKYCFDDLGGSEYFIAGNNKKFFFGKCTVDSNFKLSKELDYIYLYSLNNFVSFDLYGKGIDIASKDIAKKNISEVCRKIYGEIFLSSYEMISISIDNKKFQIITKCNYKGPSNN